MAASMELFATRGYEGTSISAIAAQARDQPRRGVLALRQQGGAVQGGVQALLHPVLARGRAQPRAARPARAACWRSSTCTRSSSRSNRETIQALVRWVLESPTMRESLRGELLALHAHVHSTTCAQAITELSGDPREAEHRHDGAVVDPAPGTCSFGVIDPWARRRTTGRRDSLRAVAERMLFSFARPRERVGNA